jgi:hypothetical protein
VSIKAGQLIHVANQIVVDRAQTAGPGSVTINREKIYELGNYNSVGSVADIPDLSFSVESFDASAEFEAVLTGQTFGLNNGKQTVTISGSPTGGTFTLTYGANTTSGLAYNAAASAVQTALQGLASIGASNATVTGSAGGPYTVTFAAAVAQNNSAQILTADGSSLTGGTPSITIAVQDTELADGTLLDPNASYPIDVASEFKAGKTNATPYNISGSVAIPYLTLESLSYRFGVTDNASQTATLKGDGMYFTPGSTYIKEVAGTNSANQSVVLDNPVYPYRGDTIAGTKYALSVSLSTGERLSYGSDYSETVGSGTTTKAITLTILAAVPTTTKIRISYASDTVASYPSFIHAGATATRPAAIRGRNITVAVGGVLLSNRWTSVQSVQLDWKVSLQKDEEFGNSNVVAQDYDVPDVTGNINIKARNYAELLQRVATIAGTTTSEVSGALTTNPTPLYIALHSPDTGVVLKSFYIPDARFNLPGFSGRVQQKLETQFDWVSDTGVLQIFKGPKTGATA